MKVDVYTNKGTKAQSTTEVSDVVFGAAWNADLVHQVVVAMQANARQGSAHTKDRGETRGGGKKPWRQKGTGRARHGSRRSPIWVGGGTTFGPRNDRDYSQKINRKMKINALYSALSAKLVDTQVLFVEDLGLSGDISTKAVAGALKNLEKVSGFETLNTESNAANIMVVMPEHDDMMVKSLRNMPHVSMTNALELNTLDVMNHRYLVVVNPQKTNEVLESRHWTKDTVASSTAPVTAEQSA